MSFSGDDMETKAPANADAARAARDGPKTALASRPVMDADATGLERRLAAAARLEPVESSGELVPPTRSSRASRRAHSRIAADPAIVADTVPSNGLGAAAAAEKDGSKSKPAETSAGVPVMLATTARAATAPSRPPYPFSSRVPVASSAASSAAAAAPSAAAAGALGSTAWELMPAKVPQKAAVASGMGRSAPAARPSREDEATEETPHFAVSAHVPADAADEQAMRAAASVRKRAWEPCMGCEGSGEGCSTAHRAPHRAAGSEGASTVRPSECAANVSDGAAMARSSMQAIGRRASDMNVATP
eukprot:scaffold9338_cov113-Isochrysis_galbana.AAC.3